MNTQEVDQVAAAAAAAIRLGSVQERADAIVRVIASATVGLRTRVAELERALQAERAARPAQIQEALARAEEGLIRRIQVEWDQRLERERRAAWQAGYDAGCLRVADQVDDLMRRVRRRAQGQGTQ